MKPLLMLLTLLVCAATAPAGSLTSISGDMLGIPRQVNVLDPGLQTASSPFSLGDFMTGFTGGLAYVESTQTFWTIYESMGQATLASFTMVGPASLTNSSVALTSGLWRGLTYNPDDGLFYALYSNGFGPYELVAINVNDGSVTPLFQGPNAGFGGMTYLAPGLLTALFTNQSGGFQLHSIDLNAQTMTPFGITFNVNMNGGLAWDTTTQVRYFAIGNDNQGNSSLYGILADGSASGSQFQVGGGYFYSALTYHGGGAVLDPIPDTPVPEPSTYLMTLSALGAAWLLRRRP